jgi:hypothetical protein
MEALDKKKQPGTYVCMYVCMYGVGWGIEGGERKAGHWRLGGICLLC